MSDRRSVIVAGVGPGLGFAISKRFAREGLSVVMMARDRTRLERFSMADPKRLVIFPGDATDPEQVDTAVSEAESRFGPLTCAVFNAGMLRQGSVLEITPSDFESCWRVGAFAGFLLGQAAARRMVPRGSGTILFTGATASLRGGAGYASFASTKFALRALSQSMAREFGPRGIHVAHIVIDGQVRSGLDDAPSPRRNGETLLEPKAIAEIYWQLHAQHRSAWTHELDLRPSAEPF